MSPQRPSSQPTHSANAARGRARTVAGVTLLAALQGGRIAGAGLDVFCGEKDATQRALAQQLLALPQVVGTPHTAASTRQSLARANRTAADCVVAALAGRAVPRHCVVADGRATVPA